MKKKIVSYGIVLGAISVSLSLVQYFGDFLYNPTFTTRIIFGVIPYLLFLFFIFLGIYKNGKHLSFFEKIKIGMTITLVATLIISGYFLIFIKIIEPDFLQKSVQIQINELQTMRYKFSDSELKSIQENIYKNASVFTQFNLSLIGNIFVGFITSLGIATILKLIEEKK